MKYYIGIDGGASSTRGVLIDEKGQTLNKKLFDILYFLHPKNR